MCMLLCCVQRSDQEQFLFETTVEASVKDTIAALVEIHNLRAKIHMLKMEGEELAKYGPAKPLDKQGIDEYQEAPVQKGPHYTQDPTGRRTGSGEELGMQMLFTYGHVWVAVPSTPPVHTHMPHLPLRAQQSMCIALCLHI